MPNKSWLPPWGDRSRDVESFRSFKTQVDTLFEDWFGRSMGGTLAPRVEVAEDATTVTVTVELPGVTEADVDIALRDDQLTIKGEKRSDHNQKKEIEGHVLHRTERSYGAFQRTLTLPYRMEPERIVATLRDGVLKITMPKPADAQVQKEGRKIEINKPPTSTGGGFPA
jgi:HSP20 family protein